MKTYHVLFACAALALATASFAATSAPANPTPVAPAPKPARDPADKAIDKATDLVIQSFTKDPNLTSGKISYPAGFECVYSYGIVVTTTTQGNKTECIYVVQGKEYKIEISPSVSNAPAFCKGLAEAKCDELYRTPNLPALQL